MSRLFISHSSQNNAEAAALLKWLREQGWDDVFLDITPDRGIAAGEKWERSLNEAASRCEAVLFLVSRPWIASRWCRKEYDLARRLNKRLFGALVEVIPVAELPSEVTETFQMVDLASGQDHRMIRTELPRTHEEIHVTFSNEGLARLKDGLARAGLDPRFFAWPPDADPGRSPYRGLKALEAEDAGIFFGRDAPIVEGLDMLRGLAEAAAPRLFVIIGASGAGKSSFLRAGLLPRLARDDRTFLALPVIRPEGGAVTGESGLLPALEAALAARGIPQSRAAIRTALAGGAATLKPLLARLAGRAQTVMPDAEGAAKPPMVTISIDQAEELFRQDCEGEELLAFVRDLVTADDPAVIVLFTIRSDSYDHLETAKPLEGLRQRTLPLLPMPRGAYQTVIEGPAARLAGTNRPLAIEARLTQRLLEDIERGGGSDALPLLAFTLGQLYLDFGGGGALRLEDYEEFGGIRGAIEAAVRRAMVAADHDARLPRDPASRLLLLRRGLIPWLANVDPETASPRRRRVPLSDIPREAEPLIRLLVEQRLLSIDRSVLRDTAGERVETTIEPAHEALLRQWGLLRGWLEEDFSALTILEAVKRAARDWVANARGQDWLNHTGTRLAEAETIAARQDLAGDLGETARDYLAGCRTRDDAEEEARLQRIENERRLAESQLRLAEADRLAAEEKAAAAQARAAASRRFARLTIAATVAVAIGLAAAGGFAALNQMQKQRTADALASAEAGRWVAKSQAELRDDDPVEAMRSALRAYRQLPREDTRSALLAALLDIPNLAGTVKLPDGPAQALAWLDGGTLGFASQGGVLRRIPVPGQPGDRTFDAAAWPSPPVEDLKAGHAFVRAIRRVAPDRVVAALSDGSVLAIGRSDPKAVELVRPGPNTVVDAAAIGRTGALVASAANGEGLSLATCDGQSCTTRRLSEGPALSVAIDESETKVAMGDEGGNVFVFEPSGAPHGRTVALGSPVTSIGFGEGGAWLAAGTASGEAVIVDPVQGSVVLRAGMSTRPVGSVAASPVGTKAAFSCGETTACLWWLRRSEASGVASAGSTRLPGQRGVVVATAWSPAGDRLATAFSDGIVRVWRSDATGQVGAAFRPERMVNLLRVQASPDGSLVAAGGGDGAVRIWDRRTHALRRVLHRPGGEFETRSVAWAPDGRIAAVHDDGAVAIWPASGGDGEPVVKRWDANANPGLAWTGGGRMLAVALGDGRIALHDPATGQDAFLPAIGPGTDPWGLLASPDGASLVATYVRGEIRRWQPAAKTHTVLRSAADRPAGERGGPESLSESPDGRRLAVTADDEDVRVLDRSAGTWTTLRTESPQTKAVAFSPDGARLAALGVDGRLYLWTVAATGFERHLSLQPSAGPTQLGSRRPANGLSWAGPDTLVVATSGGTLQAIGFDEAAWVRRAETLDLAVAPGP
ncbi:TIR domain-containing protein [uncultured Enterovirga sp.]|uniref:nSTAND1 domain-containing NTPase n=1 Tax=uncultured Enterovirga sp. TaxID=2026352 RepID=UPI0035CA5A11